MFNFEQVMKKIRKQYVKVDLWGYLSFKVVFFCLRYFKVFSHPCHTSHSRLVCLTESRWVGWLTACNIRRFQTFILPPLFAVWSRFATCRAACRASNLPLNARTGMCPSDGNKGCSQKHIVQFGCCLLQCWYCHAASFLLGLWRLHYSHNKWLYFVVTSRLEYNYVGARSPLIIEKTTNAIRILQAMRLAVSTFATPSSSSGEASLAVSLATGDMALKWFTVVLTSTLFMLWLWGRQDTAGGDLSEEKWPKKKKKSRMTLGL